ncbi:MAG: MerR family transcriptional regulator [archaeon]
MKTYKIGEFAQMTGVSIRTLRHYDQIGLFKPAFKSESHYRIYTHKDFFRLEQILALKLLGLSLSEVRLVLENEYDLEFSEILDRQKNVISGKISQLKKILEAIEKTKGTLKENNEINWEEIIYIIKVLKMEESKKWVEQFYTKEQLEKIQNRPNNEEAAREGQKRWEILIQDVRENMDKDPSSPEVQSLADRWLALINEFTQGDQGINNSLKNIYSNVDSAPEEFKNHYNQMKDVSDFINKALALRKK